MGGRVGLGASVLVGVGVKLGASEITGVSVGRGTMVGKVTFPAIHPVNASIKITQKMIPSFNFIFALYLQLEIPY